MVYCYCMPTSCSLYAHYYCWQYVTVPCTARAWTETVWSAEHPYHVELTMDVLYRWYCTWLPYSIRAIRGVCATVYLLAATAMHSPTTRVRGIRQYCLCMDHGCSLLLCYTPWDVLWVCDPMLSNHGWCLSYWYWSSVYPSPHPPIPYLLCMLCMESCWSVVCHG